MGLGVKYWFLDMANSDILYAKLFLIDRTELFKRKGDGSQEEKGGGE